MQGTPGRPKNKFKHPELESLLCAYCLSAAAAGVGMLALSQPSEGKIIYTPAHKHIGPNTLVKLGLTHDRIADFELKDTHRTSSGGSGQSGQLSVLPARQQNQVWGHRTGNRYFASALLSGVRVGPKGQFFDGGGRMASIASSVKPEAIGVCTGPWAYVNNRYLGLKFIIKRKAHFGWARLNVTCSLGAATVTGTLSGYAYETVPDRPIVTGKKKQPTKSRNLVSGMQRCPWSRSQPVWAG